MIKLFQKLSFSVSQKLLSLLILIVMPFCVAIFWNATAKELCYCDGSSADLKVKDASTACF
jgi:hypothetical protein